MVQLYTSLVQWSILISGDLTENAEIDKGLSLCIWKVTSSVVYMY